MNPNLIATPIVDKNGRNTTVLKKPDTGVSASLRVANIKPVLPPASDSGKPAGRLLPDAGTITVDELLQLGQDYPLLSVHADDGRSAIEILKDHATPESWSFVKKVMESGIAPESVTFFCAVHQSQMTSFRRNEDAEVNALARFHNTLMVAERIEREYPDMKHWDGDIQGRFVSRSVASYNLPFQKGKWTATKQFTTEEEVESAAAVAVFVLNCERNHGGLMGRFIQNKNYRVDDVFLMGTIITNPDVDAYIKNRPDEVRRVMQYMEDEDREYGNSKEEAEAMISFLEGTASSPSLSDGWL